MAKLTDMEKLKLIILSEKFSDQVVLQKVLDHEVSSSDELGQMISILSMHRPGVLDALREKCPQLKTAK